MCERSAGADAAAVAAACQRVIRSYADELQPHFLIEEETLLPLLQETPAQQLAERTLHDHQQLASLRDRMHMPDADALRQFGQILMAHVRFEERDLFPALETLLFTLFFVWFFFSNRYMLFLELSSYSPSYAN